MCGVGRVGAGTDWLAGWSAGGSTAPGAAHQAALPAVGRTSELLAVQLDDDAGGGLQLLHRARRRAVRHVLHHRHHLLEVGERHRLQLRVHHLVVDFYLER